MRVVITGVTHDAEYHEWVEAQTGKSCQNPACLALENKDEKHG